MSGLQERIDRLSTDDRRIFESFRGLGLDPGAALIATEGRPGPRRQVREGSTRRDRPTRERQRITEVARQLGARSQAEIDAFDQRVGGVQDAGAKYADSAISEVIRQMREEDDRRRARKRRS